jgi:NADH-quinone oxidoreductase subunit J
MLFSKNVLYAAFLLIITFLSVAAIYVFVHADFIAVTQIMVYVGGILVLMIFGVMLTNKISGQAVTTETHNILSGIFIGLSFFSLLLYMIFLADFSTVQWIQESVREHPVPISSTISLIGVKLMSDFVLPFEITAILLLIALIGAAFIAKKPI